MKNIMTLILCTMVALNGICAVKTDKPESDKTVYLIAGQPYSNTRNERFPTILYRVTPSHDLERVRAITSTMQGTDFIRPYREEGILLIGSEIQDGYYKIDLVDMHKVQIQSSIEVPLHNKRTGLGAARLLKRNNGAIQLITRSGKMEGDRWTHFLTGYQLSDAKGINLASIKKVPVQWTDLKDLVISGTSGGFVGASDTIWVRMHSQNGQAFVYRDNRKKIPLGWSFPQGFTLEDGQYAVQLLNSDAYRVIAKSNRGPVAKKKTTYYVFSKQNQRWQTLELNGNAYGMRGFGDWIATEQVYSGFKHQAELDAYQKKWDALEIHERPVFSVFLDRIEFFGASPTGKLYLININSNQRFEITADSIDSEVLLMDGRWVYYRDGDRLMRAEITDAGIKNTTQLLQDDLMLDMHWAFMGKW